MDPPHSCADVEEEGVVFDVLSAIAAADDTEIDRLQPPLNQVVDADALARFLRSSDGPVTVSFEYCQWTVNVRGNGAVEITERSDDE